MNDLKSGVLDINGFLVGPNTTVDELEEYFGVKAKTSNNFSYRFFDFGESEFVNNGITFKAFMSFDKKLDDIFLYPQIPELIEKYGVRGYWRCPTTGDPNKDLAYFKEVREILDAWLEPQIGGPSYKDGDCTEYQRANLFISTSAYIDERSRDIRVVGGRIKVLYE